MVNEKRIVWSVLAQEHLKEIFDYIRKDSVQNAEEIKRKVFGSTNSLIENPEKFPADKYKEKNDGTFRAYEIYKYRVSYHVSEKEIVILRIRSTKRQPEKY